MARFKNLLIALGFVLAGAIGVAFGTGTAQAVVATLVQVVNTNSSPVPVHIVAPSQPFFGLVVPVTTVPQVVELPEGLAGPLNVTAITLTNTTAAAVEVNVDLRVVSGATCATSRTGGGSPSVDVMVPANQSVHLTYPSPLVFSAVEAGAPACIEVGVQAISGPSTGIEAFVNGFVN